MQNVETEMV